MKVKEAIRLIIDSISEIYSAGESESIAYIILEYIDFPRALIFQQPEAILAGSREKFIEKVIKELKTSRPVQYILGETEFYGLKLYVNENVLIPRQETEELVQRIIKETKIPNPAILDLGTGSACIAVSLAKNIPSTRVYATDISENALNIARENAVLNKVSVNFFKDDMLHPGIDRKLVFDVIVSNPPYVLDSEKKLMHNNVLNFEPGTALFVRDYNPLEFYLAIAEIASERLVSGGCVYVEINESLAKEVCDVFKSYKLSNPEITRDINEKNRFVKAIKI